MPMERLTDLKNSLDKKNCFVHNRSLTTLIELKFQVEVHNDDLYKSSSEESLEI